MILRPVCMSSYAYFVLDGISLSLNMYPSLVTWYYDGKL